MLFSVFVNVVIMVVYAPGHRGGIWNSFSKKKLKAVNPNCDGWIPLMALGVKGNIPRNVQSKI